MKDLFLSCSKTCDFWEFIKSSCLEWNCMSERENADGSLRQKMQAVKDGITYNFIACFYHGKCESMYNFYMEQGKVDQIFKGVVYHENTCINH